MSLVKWAFVGLLLLPAAEIATFVLLALLIGWLWTGALFLTTSVVGVWLLRRTGRGNLARFAAALRREGVTAIHLESPGFAAIAGGILLALPGFITDLVGATLFVPPLRRWAGARISRVFRERRRGCADPALVELKPDEWRQVSQRAIEHSLAPKRQRKLRDRKDRTEGA